ncbi:hypothetical protein [Fulvimarina sp. MAC3]|uniref:hypothetical protein n=1 Tax=Fulvimarina sp. MAC3 TaxID=3148887 RepID=UPI0031FBA5BC
MTIFSLKSYRSRSPLFLAPIGLLMLAGCNTATPYPIANPIHGARVSANPYQPGTPEFCRQYARQTAANEYENRVDRSEDSYGARALTEIDARRDGARAYERCLRRR